MAFLQSIVPSGNTGWRYYRSINGQLTIDQDLHGASPEGSQMNGMTQHNVDASHKTVPPAGSSCTSKERKDHPDHSTVSQSVSPYKLNHRNFDERYNWHHSFFGNDAISLRNEMAEGEKTTVQSGVTDLNAT